MVIRRYRGALFTAFLFWLVVESAYGSVQLAEFNVEPSPTSPSLCNPAPQSWTTLSTGPGVLTYMTLLLTDGTVMAQNAQAPSDWWRLSPDEDGCYADGNWTQLPAMPHGYSPLYFSSAVLPDGRVIFEGGEYNQGQKDETDLGAIYDPTLNQWASVSPPPAWTNIGDAPSVILSNGTFMLSGYQSFGSMPVALLNSTNLSWTTKQPTNKGDGQDEEGWTLLPNGSVLDPEISLNQADIYNPNTDNWTQVPVPVQMGDRNCLEIGPTILRPDGTVFAVGATGNTAIFKTQTNQWTAGPAIPNGLVESDGPAAVLPNGHVLFDGAPTVAIPACYGYSIQFFEFDGTNINLVSNPPDTSISERRTQDSILLVLPTGQVLLTLISQGNYLYTGSGTYSSAWAPTVTSVPAVVVRGQKNYAMQGKQLNGMTQGSMFGDDVLTPTEN